jgi:SynChlorMet cassette radical SAM/SPASM protein ScmF
VDAIAVSSPNGNEKKRLYPLRLIYFYLTEGCNLACRHCWLAPQYQRADQSFPTLPLELIKSIIYQGKPLGLSGAKLTGGEPLLHPQIEEILGVVKKDGLRLTVETNGVLCTPHLANKIAQCKKALVSVSLDGADAKTHEWVRGVPGCFDQAVEGLHNLVDAGLKPQIIMTLMKRNKAQVREMISLAERLDAGSVKFNIIQPTARGEAMYQNDEALSVQEIVSLGNMVENELSKNSRIKIFYDQPLCFRPLGRMFGDEGDGCGVCGIKGILGVLSDGSYALCGIGENVPSLVFGRAGIDRLEDIWNGSAVLKELREGLPTRLEGVCADCVMKSRCLGKCMAQNYYRSKDLWKPFWFCEEAAKEGLFPKSRLVSNFRPAKNGPFTSEGR